MAQTDQAGDDRTAGATGGTPVWDLGVRLFHWLLVTAVAVAAATGLLGSRTTLDVHLVAGGVIATLLAARIVWGFAGGTYARFSSFVRGPRALLAHVREIAANRAPRHLGHNPLGGLMVLALMLALILLAATGLVLLGGWSKEGPIAPFASFALGAAVRPLHEALAYGLLALIACHVAGVAVESLRTRENLVRAMITGRKAGARAGHAAPPRTARPVLAWSMTLPLLAGASWLVWHLSSRPPLGVPVGVLDASYAAECGACHTPHHPSLAPARTWAGVMAGLDDHFGDNASLGAELARTISDYLAANAAERWDTAAANLLRRPATSEPLRITATDGWQQAHRAIPSEAFKTKAVGGKVNCARCHQDADRGRFALRAIAIPSSAQAASGGSS
ncbi:MAG: cytochrome b/b6 domain-containing protein [Hyphomicrobiaceae bacterium]|nr:cytochrome b/b6 domain-containing protein [Hyphomicrobiaceae bacterium]